MIDWPDDALLRPEGRDGLRRFRESGACRELESSPDRWRVAAWPWTSEPPTRVMLMNEHDDEVFVTMDEDGIWRLEAAPLHVRARTAEELEQDARGDLEAGRPLQPAHGT